jgi:zinc transport system substrate-binding protein
MLILNTVLVFAGGSNDVPRKTIVALSILPQSYFVDRISGGDINTVVLVGPGQDPHSYEPTPRQMADLSKASVWILSGMSFEIALVPKIKTLYPNLTIVDGTEGVTFRPIEDHDHPGGNPETEDHDHLDIMQNDHHTWLGREPAKILALHVCKVLENIHPENAAMYRSNYELLINDIDDEFDRLKIALAPLKGKPVFVYHPSFGYFLDEFGIVQEAVESGGKEPSAKQITSLITKAKAEHASVIFVQAEFPVDTAQTIASSLGVEVHPLDALAQDWLANIRLMGDSLMKGIQN